MGAVECKIVQKIQLLWYKTDLMILGDLYILFINAEQPCQSYNRQDVMRKDTRILYLVANYNNFTREGRLCK
jgi:hypothetical protein